MESTKHSNWPWLPLHRDIPREFYSLELDGPFQTCTLCDVNVLNEPDLDYCIERIFRGSEPIIEYAICLDCHDKVCEELSAESLQSMEDLFMQVDFEHRHHHLRSHLDDDGIDAWIGHCLIKKRPRDQCRGHQIIGRFRGDQIVLDAAPIMLCDEFLEEIQDSISKKTRERLDDFIGTQFGMPPEFCEDPSLRPVLL